MGTHFHVLLLMRKIKQSFSVKYHVICRIFRLLFTNLKIFCIISSLLRVFLYVHETYWFVVFSDFFSGFIIRIMLILYNRWRSSVFRKSLKLSFLYMLYQIVYYIILISKNNLAACLVFLYFGEY